MTTSSQTPTVALPWWRTAFNPECRPWCTLEHKPDEFTHGAAMTCTRVVDEADWFAVEIAQTTTTPAEDAGPGVLEITEPTVYEWTTRDMCELTLEEVERYAKALLNGTSDARLIRDSRKWAEG